MELYDKYFNRSLREYLKYPEKFSISISQDKVVLTPDQSSQLLKLIYSNNTIKDSVLVSIKTGLKDPNLKQVYLSTNGTNIVINFIFNLVKTELVYFDAGVWATILSYLSRPELMNLLLSDVKFDRLMINTTFWTELIRQRFPEYYVPQAVGYSWRTIYLDLIDYDIFKRIREEPIIISFTGEMRSQNKDDPKYLHYRYDDLYRRLNVDPELKEYLIINDLLELTPDKFLILLEFTELDLKLIKHLFDKYSPDVKTLDVALRIYFDGKHQDIIKYLFEYKRIDPSSGKTIEISLENLARVVFYLFDITSSFTNETFELVYNRLHESNRSDLYTRLRFMMRQKSYLITQSNIDYMLRSYPKILQESDISKDHLVKFFQDALDSYHYRLAFEIYNRTKGLLAQNDIENLTIRFRNRLKLTIGRGGIPEDRIDVLSFGELLDWVVRQLNK